MGSWCGENLRDIQAWKDDNLLMTAVSDISTKYFDATLRQLVSWRDCDELGGILKTVERMMEADADFLMGKVLMLGMDAFTTSRSPRVDTKYRNELAALCRVEKCTLREKRHALAVNYFANGEMLSACVEWEKILAEYPNDLMALKFSHDAYFFLGDNVGKRDGVARVIDKWSSEAPCYSYLHGMYAFGLEECGEYDKAEENARYALSLNRQDCWATHALGHCFEMRSDYANGIRFLESTVADWSPCYMLACHNYWHNAVFYLEGGNTESALEIFDNEISGRAKTSGMMLDFVDAASILTRIEMESRKSVGAERWREIFPLAKAHAEDHVLAFNDAHISMALSAIENLSEDSAEESAHTHIKSVSNFIGKREGTDNWRLTRDIGAVLCEAICDFNASRYGAAFEKLLSIRTQIFHIGGSHAQRDVFTQLLIHAALRSPDSTHRSQVIELLEERGRLKMNSPMGARLLEAQKRSEEPSS